MQSLRKPRAYQLTVLDGTPECHNIYIPVAHNCCWYTQVMLNLQSAHCKYAIIIIYTT